jgi:ribonuclease III
MPEVAMARQARRQQRLREFLDSIDASFENVALLDQALTHSSFVNESPTSQGRDNQRLEYLGDAVLDFLVGEWLYKSYPDAQEGELTSLRAQVVRNESLAEWGRRLGIGQYLRMGRGEAATGGPDRDANLGAAVEALIGALYLDRGLDDTRVFVNAFLEKRAEEIELAHAMKDAKSYLQEHIQSTLRETPHYQIVSEEGPDHAKIFTAVVVVNNVIWGEGTGGSKQAAQQAAAGDAIERLGI